VLTIDSGLLALLAICATIVVCVWLLARSDEAARLARRRERWHRACDGLGIPHDVRRRAEKSDPEYRHPPTWYAGRRKNATRSEGSS
jgi:hypothetical protein